MEPTTSEIVFYAVLLCLPAVATVLYLLLPKQTFLFPDLPDVAVKWLLAAWWVTPGLVLIGIVTRQLFFISAAYYSMYFVLAVTGCYMVASLLIPKKEEPPEPAPIPLPPPPLPQNTRVAYTEAVMNAVVAPPQLIPLFREAVYKYTDSKQYKLLQAPNQYFTNEERARINDPQRIAETLTAIASTLPKRFKLGKGKSLLSNDSAEIHYRIMELPDDLMRELRDIEVELMIPDELRTQHAMVIASSGFGKSQLFQSMILNDLDTDAALVVIDSQNDLINKLATRVDPSRLILIDAIAAPPALNIFKLNDPGLLEYVFGALDAKMTSKQAMVYRYLCRHVIHEDGNVSLLLDILQNPDQVYNPQNDAARAFFAEYKNPKGDYKDTRQEIMRRLLTLLESNTFNLMLTAPDLRISIKEAIEDGKVVLINTAKADTSNAGAALFGRFWLALVLQTVMQGSRKPVRLFVDEFADYASDELETIFTQSRKYNLAMTCAFQSLAQLPDRLRAIMATNTSIKLAGGVSAEDRGNLARQMDCEPEFIAQAKRGTFAAWFRDMGVTYFPVEFGRLEKLPELSRLADIHADMRRRYSPTPPPHKNALQKGREVGKTFMVDDDEP